MSDQQFAKATGGTQDAPPEKKNDEPNVSDSAKGQSAELLSEQGESTAVHQTEQNRISRPPSMQGEPEKDVFKRKGFFIKRTLFH